MKFHSSAAALLAAIAFTAPASASDVSKNEAEYFESGYNFGFVYGSLVTTCVHYSFGDLSKNDFVTAVKDAKKEPQWIKKRLLSAFSDNTLEQNLDCGPIVRSILGSAKQSKPTSFKNAVARGIVAR